MTAFYRRTPTEITSVKKKYDITGKYILFVGNIEPRKNLKKLMLAYELSFFKTSSLYREIDNYQRNKLGKNILL
jgi:hypothetical protein